MTEAILEPIMADDKPKTLSVKLPIDVIESARIVSAYRNQVMAEMLGEMLRPILEKAEKEEVAKRSKPANKKGETKS